MQYEDLDDDMKIELQKKFEENRKIILSMNPEEFLERLIKLHDPGLNPTSVGFFIIQL